MMFEGTGWDADPAASTVVGSNRRLSCAVEVNDAAMNIHLIDPLRDPRWVELVRSHPRASVFHSTNWLKALRTAYDYEPVVITTSPPGSTLSNGLVFCRINSWLTGRRLVSLPFSDHCEPLVSSLEECDDLLIRTTRCVDKGKWKYIEARPKAFKPSSNAGFGRGHTYCFHSVDLRRSLQELFSSFHKDCVQRKIRRAEREDLKYEDGTSDELLSKFYILHTETRRRHYLPPQPLTWFRGLVTAFGNKLKIRVASKNDVPVASILTLSHNRTMTYKYGCSEARSHNLGGMALLFWRTIQEAKNNGFEELEMGRSDLDNPGLIAFKEHWGATKTELAYWIYPHRPQAHFGSWQRRLARSIVSASPNIALKTVGKLLYRHIG